CRGLRPSVLWCRHALIQAAASGSGKPDPPQTTRTATSGRRRGALELVDDVRVREGRDVTELAALGDVLEQAAHDLAGAGLRQVLGEQHLRRPGDLADALADVLAQLLGQLVVALEVA